MKFLVWRCEKENGIDAVNIPNVLFVTGKKLRFANTCVRKTYLPDRGTASRKNVFVEESRRFRQ
jgi:hypothetical protein